MQVYCFIIRNGYDLQIVTITIYYKIQFKIGGLLLIKQYSIIIFTVLLFLISACSNDNQTNNNQDQLIIQTTLYPLEYIAAEIGGNHVHVETIYPPGVDAHTYEPTSKEITGLAKADAFIYLGAGLEGFADKAASALDKQDVELIEIGKHESLFAHIDDKNNDDSHEHHDGSPIDPHIWLDPLRMNQIADILYEELIKLNSENETDFKNNLTQFKETMIDLNNDFENTLKDKDNKQILVTHAAYGYWERIYGIKQLSISGLSTSDEPSQKQLAEIARLAKENNLNYVIYGQNDSNQTADIIKEHIKAEKLQLHNLEVLTEDDLNNDANYLSLMKDNLDVLDKATH